MAIPEFCARALPSFPTRFPSHRAFLSDLSARSRPSCPFRRGTEPGLLPHTARPCLHFPSFLPWFSLYRPSIERLNAPCRSAKTPSSFIPHTASVRFAIYRRSSSARIRLSAIISILCMKKIAASWSPQPTKKL